MPVEQGDRKRVLVLSASVGAGHTQAARAIVEGLAPYAAELEVRAVDVLNFAPRLFRAFYARGYAFLVSYLPRLYGVGYWLTDRPDGPTRSLMERRRLRRERRAMGPLIELLLGRRWDLLVHTHFLAPPVAAFLRDRGRLDCPQLVAVTDNVVHRYWYSEHVDHWFLSADLGRRRLIRWGVPAERITVSGMPVHPKWLRPAERERVLAEWHLPAGRPIVLLAGGADFVCGPVVPVARELSGGADGPCVVVLGGRNKKLLADLAGIDRPADRLVSLAFTDRAAELAAAAKLIITKAGGATTAECLAKRLPMVLLPPVPGQEAGNARYFEREGAAVIARDAGDACVQARRLLGDAAALEAMARRAGELYRPAVETVVGAVRTILGFERTPGSLSGG